MDKKDGNILEKKTQDNKEFDEFKSDPTKEAYFSDMDKIKFQVIRIYTNSS